MPFTPFHLGPALLFGLPLRNRLDLPTFVVANLVVDVRATLVFFGLLDGPLHGPLHTFVGASALAILLSAVVVAVGRRRSSLWRRLGGRPADVRGTAAAALSGTWLHVALDAPLYADVTPFAPLAGNPFLGVVGPAAVYGFCFVAGATGTFLLGYVVLTVDDGDAEGAADASSADSTDSADSAED